MSENSTRPNETPLESWKEIAAYLKRDVRTVKRWEKAESLPVRRHLHQARSTVYAYPSELDAWWATRQPRLEVAPPWRRPVPALALTAVLLLALASAGSGPILTPPGAAAGEPGDGMTARRIFEGGGLPYGTVSPDGRYFTLVDWDTGDLAIVEVATLMNNTELAAIRKKMRHLTNKGTWAESEEYAEISIMSPDGTQVAYAWFNGQFYDLRLVGLDGSEPRVLYRNEDVEYLDTGHWSPDGNYVSASLTKADKANQIVVVSVADGLGHVLKTVDWRHAHLGPFSPDGRYLVYDFPPREDSPERDVFVLATDGSREIHLVKHPANDRALGWTLDGQTLLFTSDRTGDTGVWAIDVRDGKPQGAPRLVKPKIGRIHPFGFTQQGAFYYGVQTSLRDGYIAPLNLATGKGLGAPTRVSERFIGSTLWPQWSRDGKSLVYLRSDRQRPRSLVVVIRSLESGEERELRPELILGHQFYLRPSFSPDGSSIVLATWDKKGRQGIYRIDASTAAVTPVVRAGPGTWAVLPAWSPDGKTVFYLRQNRTDKRTTLVARELASGQEKKLYEATEPFTVQNFAVSHDGRELTFLLGEQTTKSTALLVMPITGGEPRELLKVQHPDYISRPTGMAWTPDGRYVLFRQWREGDPNPPADLWAIPAAGGEPEKVGQALPGLLGLDVHPDGRRIAFTAGRYKAEVWVLENFLPALKAEK